MIKSLKIAGQDYEVKPFKGGESNNLWGWTDTEKKVLHINTTKGTPKARTMTLFHEAMHGIVEEYGINATLSENEEELLVRILEVAVPLFLQDNRQFTKDFLKIIT